MSPKNEPVNAESFLRGHLGLGKRMATEIMALAQERGISRAALRRARAELGVESFGVTWWALPGVDLPEPTSLPQTAPLPEAKP